MGIESGLTGLVGISSVGPLLNIAESLEVVVLMIRSEKQECWKNCAV